jgi:uncharacterized membrane protein
MRNCRLSLCFVIFAILILVVPLTTTQAQNYFQYDVNIKSDGSADWVIIQFSNANATTDSWDTFQQKVFDLVDSASSSTNRPMTVDPNTLQINTTIVADSKTTEYSFTWQNFTLIQNNDLLVGDVFQVANFFDKLYGDAELQLNYPAGFLVKSVSPVPYEQQNSLMKWSRTEDLTNNKVNIILANSSQTRENPTNNNLITDIVIIAVVVTGLFLSFLGLYMFKRRKTNGVSINQTGPLILSEEDKVIKLIKSSGSSMRQSQIAEQTKFSKAKTSQLLAILEKKGYITRYKSGRDKIVNLKE